MPRHHHRAVAELDNFHGKLGPWSREAANDLSTRCRCRLQLAAQTLNKALLCTQFLGRLKGFKLEGDGRIWIFKLSREFFG
jgi:hypothetical protein